MIGQLPTARLLDGYCGLPPVARSAPADLVVRVGAPAEHQPRPAELDLKPVIRRAAELVVVDAMVRAAAAPQVPTRCCGSFAPFDRR
jgi:hypothetical protein